MSSNDTYTPILSPSRANSYSFQSSPRRTGSGDAFLPPPSAALDYSQTPFLPITQSPPSPYYSPPQNQATQQLQHRQQQQQQQGKSTKSSIIGFRRHRHKTSFKILFWGGMIAVVVGIVVALYLMYLSWNSKINSNTDNRDQQTISLFGRVAKVDTSESKISVNWAIKLCESPNTPNRKCVTPATTINVFMNENCSIIVQSDWYETGRTNSSLRIGIFDTEVQYVIQDSKEDFEGMPLSVGFEPFFQTDLSFSITKLISSRLANDLAYPFDHYETSSIFCASYFEFVTDPSNPDGMELNKTSEIFGPLTVELGGYRSRSNAISSWTIRSEDSEVGPNNKNDRFLRTRISRSGVVIGFAAIIWITNWLITFVVLAQTALSYVYKKEFTESLVVVPLTALFSMPAVRSVAPGAPNFGSYYDITGFNPQISIVSLCTALILAKTLVSSEHVWTRESSSSHQGRRGSSKKGRRGARKQSNPLQTDSDSEDEKDKVPLQLQVPTLAFNG